MSYKPALFTPIELAERIDAELFKLRDTFENLASKDVTKNKEQVLHNLEQFKKLEARKSEIVGQYKQTVVSNDSNRSIGLKL